MSDILDLPGYETGQLSVNARGPLIDEYMLKKGLMLLHLDLSLMPGIYSTDIALLKTFTFILAPNMLVKHCFVELTYLG